MDIDVYDFDKTIYDGDSTLDFYFFCLKRHISIIIYIPIQLYFFAIYILGICSKKKFKEKFYMFLKGIENIEKEIEKFWEKNRFKINDWYKIKSKENHVIISASPEFLLKGICKELKVKLLIASQVDKYTGKYIGENCYGIEKLHRLENEVSNYRIVEFYSDSLSDEPLAKIAEKSFMVLGKEIIKWNEYNHTNSKKIKEAFFSKHFILFIFVGIINTLNGIIFATVYSLLFKVNVAFVLGYLTSLTIAYTLNSKIIFREVLCISRYIKFFISYIPNFIIQNIILIIFYNLLGWNQIVVYTIASAIGVPVTFLLAKFYAFNK